MRALLLRTMSILVFGALVSPAFAGGKPRLEDLAWMTGAWRGDVGGVAVEETWTGADGGMMLAVHKDVKEGRVTDWEFLRIEEEPGGIVYLSSPRGAPATPFRLIELAGERAVFANPEHDFPKRILYWRAADGALHAAIDAGEGTKRIEWRWTRAR